ncbi:hypothetical protein EPN15_04445 [Patescibacteria group bacterium]|nr:MAG: hypothetical protein EPN15_04445 [Patescibacteria group bacterium]
MSFKSTRSVFVKNFGGQRRKKMNDKISIELYPDEWESIIVSLKYRKTIIVTEKGQRDMDRLISKIKNRLQEAAPSKS